MIGLYHLHHFGKTVVCLTGFEYEVQPIFVTLSSTGSSPWKTANFYPQQLSFAVISSEGSSWSIDVCYEDPSGT